MSSNSPDIAAYYLNYKSAVYQNLFSGIVYGEQPLACFCSSIISCLSCLTGIYVILYAVSVHILL